MGRHILEISLAEEDVEVENTLTIDSLLNLGHVFSHLFHFLVGTSESLA